MPVGMPTNPPHSGCQYSGWHGTDVSDSSTYRMMTKCMFVSMAGIQKIKLNHMRKVPGRLLSEISPA